MVCTQRLLYKRKGAIQKEVVQNGGVQKVVVQKACCIKEELWKWALYKRGLYKVCVLNGVEQIESCVNVSALFVSVVSGLSKKYNIFIYHWYCNKLFASY